MPVQNKKKVPVPVGNYTYLLLFRTAIRFSSGNLLKLVLEEKMFKGSHLKVVSHTRKVYIYYR